MFYIIALCHTMRHEKYINFWRPDNAGYCYAKTSAGVYENPKKGYHDSDSHMPIPVEIAEPLFQMLPYGREQVLPMIPNNPDTWRYLNLKMTKDGLVKIPRELEIIGSALITPDREHRYLLSRKWDASLPEIMFIGLNPSRADDARNDATITRCVNFSKAWGYGAMYFANLYSYRTPYVKGPIPEELRVEKDGPDKGKEWSPLLDKLDVAVGADCDKVLGETMDQCSTIVCAWGGWDFTYMREIALVEMILSRQKSAFCMGRNKDGSPKHPLYLHSATQLVEYRSHG